MCYITLLCIELFCIASGYNYYSIILFTTRYFRFDYFSLTFSFSFSQLFFGAKLSYTPSSDNYTSSSYYYDASSPSFSSSACNILTLLLSTCDGVPTSAHYLLFLILLLLLIFSVLFFVMCCRLSTKLDRESHVPVTATIHPFFALCCC